MRRITILTMAALMLAPAACKRTANGDVEYEKPVVGTQTDTMNVPQVEVSKDTATITTPDVDVKKDTTKVTVPKVKVKP